MAEEDVRAKRQRIQRQLLSKGSCTRTALVDCLTMLSAEGLLTAELGATSKRTLRREVQTAVEQHASMNTPYGPVMQSMDLGAPALRQWEYANPFAFLHYLTSISDRFGDMMAQSARDRTTPLRLIIYIDEVNPGNPLRPDKGRSTQAIYWCFADWPQWALQRASVWILFGVLRSSLMTDLPGGVSGLMRHVLNVFFSKNGNNFQRGCIVQHRASSILVHADFGGFLADEKAHKEILEVKGASGTKPCITCKNLVHRLDIPAGNDYLVRLDCVDYHLLDYHSNDSVYEMVDRLTAAKTAGMTKTEFARLEQVLGLKYAPQGLLFDSHLRTILKPVDNFIRDWMHCLVSGGVLGTEVSLLLQEVQSIGVKLEMLQEFAKQFRLPKARGRVDPAWFSDHRISEEQLRSFASEQLNMVPIVHCFLVDVLAPMGLLPNHIKCFGKLRDIVEIVSLGPHSAMPHRATLRALIVEHGRLFKRVFPFEAIKPKFHHLLHLSENMDAVGVLLSCFVTERKHRIVKRAACHVFRHFEHTVLSDLINSQAEEFLNGGGLTPYKLIEPKEVDIAGVTWLRSTTVALPIGEVHANDVVGLTSRRVGMARAFWARPRAVDTIVVEYLAYRCLDSKTWCPTPGSSIFADAADIVAPIVWAVRSEQQIRVVLPTSWEM